MSDMTLREICEATEVSRRAIQGYEQAGLVAAFARNERGYLLYDEKAQERIKQIKLFQELGFSVKEIKGIIDAPRNELKLALEKQIGALQEQSEKIGDLIIKARELIEAL